MKIKDTGEFHLIDQIKKSTGTLSKSTILGIGDDAAILKGDAKFDTLLTTDMLIEDKHFRLSEASAFQIGQKALAVNLSDIAAMGGEPTSAVVSVGINPDLPTSFAHELYRGIKQRANEFGVDIVGGDTNSSEKLVISVALLGKVKKNKALLRSGAKVGDVIFVTGFLGGSYESKKHLDFTPRLKESQFLSQHFKIHAMMDISDGLASDIHRIAKASQVGAWISYEAVPLSAATQSVEQSLTQGEDFELLFTLSPSQAAKLSVNARGLKLAPFHPVGKIVEKAKGVRLIRTNGQSQPLLEKGFDHFR